MHNAVLYMILILLDAMMESPMASTENKARAAKAAAADATKTIAAERATAKDPMAAFTFPNFEFPEMMRSFTEQGVSQTREAYARMKSAAEEATDMLEDSLETARESVREVQFKALDMAKSNADAAFDLMRKLLGTTSVADAVELQTAFARERFEALVDYSKDVQATVTKAGSEAAKPAQAMFEKAMSAAKAA
jgi:phasin